VKNIQGLLPSKVHPLFINFLFILVRKISTSAIIYNLLLRNLQRLFRGLDCAVIFPILICLRMYCFVKLFWQH